MLKGDAELDILMRVLDGQQGAIAPAAARELLKFGFAENDQQRITELSARAREGVLSPEESAELESFVNVGHFIAFLRARAQRALAFATEDTSS